MSERRFAVLVGSSRYAQEPKLQDLRCPANDVDGLEACLRTNGEFASIVVLKNRPHHQVMLEVNRTLKRAGKDDLVFLYFSGHGKLDLANRLHLCTANTVIDALEATSVPVQSVKDYIDVSPCRRVVLVLDCCFSGAAGGVFARSGVDDQLQLLARGRGTYLMTASTGTEVAIENDQDEYSVFSKQLIHGLKSGEADLDQDGVVTMDELYSYVHDRVLEEGFQEPMKWAINVRGRLPIAKSGRMPREERRKRIRAKLMALAANDTVSDRLLAQALELLAKPKATLDAIDAARDALLDRLEAGQVTIGDFTEAWFGPSPASQPVRRDVDRPPSQEAPRTTREEIGGDRAAERVNARPRPAGDVRAGEAATHPSYDLAVRMARAAGYSIAVSLLAFLLGLEVL